MDARSIPKPQQNLQETTGKGSVGSTESAKSSKDMLSALHIIGSSHISSESVNAVKDYIANEKPQIIALELDKGRLRSLLEKEKEKYLSKEELAARKKQKPSLLSQMKQYGAKGALFAAFAGYAESKMGKLVGVSPGDEMKTAFLLGKEYDAKVALIDQDINITLKRLSKAFTWKEKRNFLADIFLSPFQFKRRKKLAKNFDLRSVPKGDFIEDLLHEVKHRYPNFYRVLIHERNIIMAARLHALLKHNPDAKILAVVGAGHKAEIIRMLHAL